MTERSSAAIFHLKEQEVLEPDPSYSRPVGCCGRATYDLGSNITADELFRRTGVLYRSIPVIDSASEQEAAFKEAVPDLDHYDYRDVINVSRKGLGDKYDELMRMFYDEHIHADDEVRFVLDGSGYWDVRDVLTDHWLRLHIQEGDFINIPKGAYHRYSLDDNQYMKCMRMFAGSPVWTAFYRNKDGDSHPARQQYVQEILRRQTTR